MFKSIITTGKTIGTLSAKAGKATGRGTVKGAKVAGHGVKVGAVVTIDGAKKGTKTTGRGFAKLGKAIASEYRANKVNHVPVTDFPFETLA